MLSAEIAQSDLRMPPLRSGTRMRLPKNPTGN